MRGDVSAIPLRATPVTDALRSAAAVRARLPAPAGDRLRAFPDHAADAVVVAAADGTLAVVNTLARATLDAAVDDAVDALFPSQVRDGVARDVVPRAVREGRWGGVLELSGTAMPAMAFGHRAADGELLALTLVVTPPHAEGAPRTLADVTACAQDLRRTLGLAIGAARALGALHQHGLVHRDLTPDCFISDGDDVRITGLASARPLAPGVVPPRDVVTGITGSPPYVSPELTGRVNRAVDRRSDLYALGVILYELVTGHLPFEADDPLEWVHCHVARIPPRPGTRVEGLPAVVDDIVMRLLSKRPDDRYQSAAGVVADLERVLADLDATGHASTFPLGAGDVRDVFAIPEKLYARAAQRDALDAAFARAVAGGAVELALVTGVPGIGKSTLVRAMREPVTQARGLFAVGAVDPQRRDEPYAPFTRALGELVQQALAEPPARLEALRTRLREAVGGDGVLVCELVPRAELLLGACPPVTDLPFADAQRRLHRVLSAVFDVFASDRPLLLFLDDLQWADAGSVQLLVHLARARTQANPPIRMLLVAAYRDEELEPGHPLALVLPELRGAPAPLELHLSGLDAPALRALLSETLGASPETCEAFAGLVLEKTGGVPYFVLQFLHVLHRRGLVRFDAAAGAWRWDADEIAAAELTDNVVAIVTQRLRRLPEPTQQLLQAFACVGERVAPATLAVAAGLDEPEVEETLWDAQRERLIVAREGEYRFSHDRVREATLAGVPPQERAVLQLEVGRRLLRAADGAPGDDEVFVIAAQLNAGEALLTDPQERRAAAELNLQAGVRAMKAAALRSAARHLRAGAGFLADDAWETDARLAFDLHLAWARCEQSGGDLDAADRLVTELVERAREPGDLADAAHVMVDSRLARGRAVAAMEDGVEALRRLGVTVTLTPSLDDTAAAAGEIWAALGDRPIETLLDLPPAEDPRVIAATRLLGPVMTAAFLGGRHELGNLLMIEGVRLSLRYGNTPMAPLLHALFGSMLAARFGLHDRGRRLMRAAHALVEASEIDAFAAQTSVYVGTGSVWTDAYTACLPFFRFGWDRGVRVGDLTNVAFCGFFACVWRLAAGDPLDDVLRECDAQLPFADDMKLPDHRDAVHIVERAARSLRGDTSALGDYEDAGFDDAAFQERLRTVRLPFFLAADAIHRLLVLVIAHRPEDALAAAERFDELAWVVAYHPMLGFQEPLGALARAAAWASQPPERQADLRARIAAAAVQLDAWAEHAPENFAAPARLVTAELARIDGRDEAAVRAYEDAIETAAAHGLGHWQALAWECLGRHRRGQGRASLGLSCLREARDGWAQWGAAAKVAALQAEFPALDPAAAAPAVAGPGLDLLAVARGSQAISGQLDPEELPAMLLRIAVSAAGAQAGRLLLAEGEDQAVVAVAEVEGDDISVRRPDGGEDRDLPRAVTDYVIRTRERVLLADARADPTFGADPAIAARGVRSLLCQPILRDRALLGLLVLEHGLVEGAFTADRLTAVEVLSAQAAISVETARLYDDVREENRIRRLTEADLRASEEQFRTLVESAPDGIVIADEHGRVVLVNSRVEELFCHARDELTGRPAGALVPDVDWVASARPTAAASVLEVERVGRRRDGGSVEVEVTLSPLPRGEVTWTIGIVRDVTERKRLEHELEHAADHDPLTGLLNRPRFERELASALERVERSATDAVLMVLDLDHIRDINDSLGPQVGDDVIRALGHALRERLRPADVLARLGGNEYALILSRTDVQGASALAGELLDLVRHHALVSDGVRVRTTASIGIVPITTDVGNAQDLLAAADVALDQAKDGGRDRAVRYTPDSGRRAAARHTWSERIRHALEHEEFTLHAQPILDLRSGQVTHTELLIRLVDGERLVPPADFLPTAERTGLITAIDRWVIRRGARLAASDGRLVELNLSAKSLADPELAGYIEEEVRAAGADPATLVFEITETAAIANLPSAAALASRLTALGCHFALDDFGVGFGSFYYLKRLPLDYIKIDGDFIQTLARSPTDQHVTKAIVDVAQGLGLKTIAEYVEDAETLEMLRGYGVDYAQGFHIGRPAPLEA